MSGSVMEVFSISVRIILITLGNSSTAIFFSYILLGKRRNLGPFILYNIGKILISTGLISCVLQHYYGGAQWFQALTLLAAWMFTVLTYAVNYYTFKGGLLKVAIGMLLGDMLTMFFGYFSIALFNLIERKKDIWIFFDEFQLLDLCIPILTITLGLCFYHCTAVYLYKFREYELKHKKLLWVLFIGYAAIGNMTMLISYDTMAVAGALAVLVSCATGAGFCYLVITYKRKLENRQTYLRIQQKVMEAHYEAVQGRFVRWSRISRESTVRCRRLWNCRTERLMAEDLNAI